jgi:uncharacterized damage-inducible protein DinB
MIAKELEDIYVKNLDSLIKEVESYQREEDLWKLADGISNTAGNLCLHLAGNLKHFIGATLGNTGYVRDREAEFGSKNLSRHQILKELKEARKVVSDTLSVLDEKKLEADFPFEFAGKKSIRYYLMFFLAHFNYHLGQVNYHRRILT